LWVFCLVSTAVAALVFVLARLLNNDYVFFAGYTVLQFVVLGTAWNILGGYCGYVNFGTAAFFALGAYSTVFFHKTYPLPIPVLLFVAAAVCGLVGFGTGYLTLRLRGAFFAIATLALAVVLQTLVVNWTYVGGSRGAYVIRPADVDLLVVKISYIQYLFAIMILLAVAALVIARAIEHSKLGYGFATIRDDELAAEASGVPTLKLKLIATTLSGALMGMAGAPFPYYIGYLEPASAFGLPYAVNSIAMPMIGGTTTWIGPLIGALLLGTLQQIATVTISSVVNLLIVGFLLVGFVIAAPNGIVGLIQEFLRAASPSRVDARSIGIILFSAYGFIAGVLGIVFSLAVMTAPGTAGLAMAVAGFVLAALYLASAYGLLKIHGWGPLVATIAFAMSIPIAAIYMWFDRMPGNIAYHATGIGIAIAAIWCFQLRNVRKLYQPHLGEQRVAA